MLVGICDDDAMIFRKVERQVKEYLKTISVPCEFYTFQRADELLSFCSDLRNKLDLLLIEIEMKEISGIELSKKVHRLQPDCQVAYHTNCLKYAPDVYETEHCYFILKEQLEQRLPSLMAKVLEQKQKKEDKIIVEDQAGKTAIYKNEIIYIERMGRKSYIVMKDRNKIETCKKLDELQKMLGEGFVRCHNSFVVSVTKVRTYKRLELLMEEESVISISRKYVYEVKQVFDQWYHTHLSP